MSAPRPFRRIPPSAFRAGMLFGLLATGAACGGAPVPSSGPATGGVREAAAQEAGWSPDLERTSSNQMAPPGYGTLSQDDITVPLEAGTLRIKATPLQEWVIRLTAPDTYERLKSHKVARGEEILRAAARAGMRDWPLVMLVTFFTRAYEDSYEPYDLQVRNQNFVFRPIEILPITPGFTRERLRQQDVQFALYLYEGDIDLDLPLTLDYQGAVSSRWTGIRRRLDEELSIVLSRTGGAVTEESP
ncbi:MAG: hypothetical protein RRA92_01785 [Gemmatimonadota bacterium]|nr:hypothetical protein [Gemmatimonadota bacterium]